jgi:hypothetical protein
MTPLSALSAIISSGVAEIESVYAARGAAYPSLDEPFRPDPMDGVAQEAVNLIIAAASQLIATIRPAPISIFSTAASVHLSNCLSRPLLSNVILDASNCGTRNCKRGQRVRGFAGCRATSKCYFRPSMVANHFEFLKGMHVNDIAKIVGTDTAKLGTYPMLSSFEHDHHCDRATS